MSRAPVHAVLEIHIFHAVVCKQVYNFKDPPNEAPQLVGEAVVRGVEEFVLRLDHIHEKPNNMISYK